MDIRIGKIDDFEQSMELVAAFCEESLSEYGVYLDPQRLKETYNQVWKTSYVAVADDK